MVSIFQFILNFKGDPLNFVSEKNHLSYSLNNKGKFVSFSQENKDSFTLTRINKTNSKAEEETEIKFDGFNIGNVFTDAIETITEFVLKN